jgi:xanthine dehydrogenase YagT iron-sulfur-binding subunit
VAYTAHDGFQGANCTWGHIMPATAVTTERWGPSDDDVREAMSGNICRCGAYPGIVAAVQAVRQTRSAEGGGPR